MSTSQSAKSESSPTKDLVNKDNTVTKLVELATADVSSVDDLIGVFGNQGVEYSTGEEITNDYRLITGDEKQLFLQRVQGCRTGVVKWRFIVPPGGREFVAAHLIIDGHGKFILNDSSKGGFYGQLSEITSKRLDEKWPEDRAHAGVICDRGFKQNNEFYFRTRCSISGHNDPKHPVNGCVVCDGIGHAIPKAEVDDVPAAQKEKARPTWKLDFV